MIKLTACVVTALSCALIPVLAGANSDVWYVVPENPGDCGDECYTPPIAWIDEAGGDHAFGVSCEGSMFLGGLAMDVSEPPFTELEIVIDGKSFGRFSVHNGLNDVYVSPTNPAGQSAAHIGEALKSGRGLHFRIAGQESLDLTLSGSKAAIELLDTLCQPLLPAATDFHTTYALQEGACKTGSLITWAPTGISGAGFYCRLGESFPAGTGLVSYKAECVIDGRRITDQVAFDMGNRRDHFSFALPGYDWTKMFPCTPVEGLEGTN